MQKCQAREKSAGSGCDQHHCSPGSMACFATRLDNGSGLGQDELSRLFKACVSLSYRPSVFTPCSGSALQLHYLEDPSYIRLPLSFPLLVRPPPALTWCLGIAFCVVSLLLLWPPQSLPPIHLFDFQNLNYICGPSAQNFLGRGAPCFTQRKGWSKSPQWPYHMWYDLTCYPPTPLLSLMSIPSPPTCSHTGHKAQRPQGFGTPFTGIGGLFTNKSRAFCVTSFRSLIKYRVIREAIFGYPILWDEAKPTWAFPDLYHV